MREPRFYLPTGEELPKSETSRHHLFGFEYEKGSHRRLRMNGRCVVRMANEYHLPQYETSLHANVPPPIVPQMGLAQEMNDFMNHQRETDINPLERMEHLIQYLGYLSFSSPRPRVREESALIQDNLMEQMVFIRKGAVHHG